MAVLQTLLSTAVEATAPFGPELWRRHVGILLDGLLPSPGDGDLTGEPPTGDQIHAIVTNWRPQPRLPGNPSSPDSTPERS